MEIKGYWEFSEKYKCNAAGTVLITITPSLNHPFTLRTIRVITALDGADPITVTIRDQKDSLLATLLSATGSVDLRGPQLAVYADDATSTTVALGVSERALLIKANNFFPVYPAIFSTEAFTDS